MTNDIWEIWRDVNFLIPTIALIMAIIIAIYFECKFLDERKKNQRLMKYAAKLTIALLNRVNPHQM